MPRRELPKEDWPKEAMLVGCLVHHFNPSDWRKDEDKTLDLDNTTKVIFRIRWKGFVHMNKTRAICGINDVIREGNAEYLPGNKDGMIVEHDTEDPSTVLAFFNMDGQYYAQYGVVSEVCTRPRGRSESLHKRCCLFDARVGRSHE